MMPVLPMMLGSPVSVVLLVPMTLVFHRFQGSMTPIGQRHRTEQADRDRQKQNSFHRLQIVLREKHSIRGWGRIDFTF